MSNRARLLAFIAGGVILIQGTVGVYLISRSARLAKKLDYLTPQYVKISKEEKELRDRMTNLLKEYDAMKDDRNDLLLQTKNLLAAKTKAKEIEASASQVQAEKERLEAEKVELRNQIEKLRSDFERYQAMYDELQGSQEGVVRENVRLGEELEKAKAEAASKRVSVLEKENTAMRKQLVELQSLRQGETKLKSQIYKFKTDLENLQKVFTELNKNYSLAVEKNRAMEGEVKRMPQKFAEISRQNKALIKETAQMHYNLGVFYSRNKEYERALAEFEKAVDIDPYDAYSYFNLGYIYAEYLVDRKKAIEYFRHYLTLAKGDDKDVEWVRKYLVTWETFDGKKVLD